MQSISHEPKQCWCNMQSISQEPRQCWCNMQSISQEPMQCWCNMQSISQENMQCCCNLICEAGLTPIYFSPYKKNLEPFPKVSNAEYLTGTYAALV